MPEGSLQNKDPISLSHKHQDDEYDDDLETKKGLKKCDENDENDEIQIVHLKEIANLKKLLMI